MTTSGQGGVGRSRESRNIDLDVLWLRLTFWDRLALSPDSSR